MRRVKRDFGIVLHSFYSLSTNKNILSNTASLSLSIIPSRATEQRTSRERTVIVVVDENISLDRVSEEATHAPFHSSLSNDFSLAVGCLFSADNQTAGTAAANRRIVRFIRNIRLIPVTIFFQLIKYRLCVGIDEIGPCFEQRMHNVVDETDLETDID